MASQLETDEAGSNRQPDEDEGGVDDELDVSEVYEPEPELPISDKVHDQALVLIAVLIGVGALVLILGLNLLDATGILGESCGLHLRTAQCYQQDGPDLQQKEYGPTPTLPYHFELH